MFPITKMSFCFLIWDIILSIYFKFHLGIFIQLDMVVNEFEVNENSMKIPAPPPLKLNKKSIFWTICSTSTHNFKRLEILILELRALRVNESLGLW